MDFKLLTDEEFPCVNRFVDKADKIGHVRADHNGYRWWTTFWDVHTELKTPTRCKEIELVSEYLLENLFAKGLGDVITLCNENPQAVVGEPKHGEYNFYINGKECVYWVRLITRFRDYNMYLHCHVKPQEGESSHEN